MIEFPRIEGLGVKIYDEPLQYVKREDLKEALGKRKFKQLTKFIGVATCPINGLYPSDVEAALERMETGNLTGSQLYWD
jgi:hypothetical protein